MNNSEDALFITNGFQEPHCITVILSTSWMTRVIVNLNILPERTGITKTNTNAAQTRGMRSGDKRVPFHFKVTAASIRGRGGVNPSD